MVVYNIALLLGNLFCVGALRTGLMIVYCLNSSGSKCQYCYPVVHPPACAGYKHMIPVDRHSKTQDGATKLVHFRFYRPPFVFYCIPLSVGLSFVAQRPLIFCHHITIGSNFLLSQIMTGNISLGF